MPSEISHYALVSDEFKVIISILTEPHNQPPVARTAGLNWLPITCESGQDVLAKGLQYPSGNWRFIYMDGGTAQEIPDG